MDIFIEIKQITPNKNTMKTALITGASSGIGLELAKIHASKSGDLVIVARNKAKLDELKSNLEQQYSIHVTVISKDLSTPNAAIEVFTETESLGIQVDYLINNAGFGLYGKFEDSDWEAENDMIQVNITALTQFTKLYLPGMIARKNGKIMNVASTAAFVPGPTMAVYCATKPYVLSFSEAVNNEVNHHGISITALCPGATASGFSKTAKADKSALFSKTKLATSEEVAQFGYKAMLKGKQVAIHGFMNQFLAFIVRFTPRSLVVKISRKVIDK
jgi:short-subunit dehydrogenase